MQRTLLMGGQTCTATSKIQLEDLIRLAMHIPFNLVDLLLGTETLLHVILEITTKR